MDDFKLTDHFSFFELTKTSNAALQDRNREAALAVKEKLAEVAELLELVRERVGQPIQVHSAFRSAELNAATSGSSSTSQHTKGEAVDFSAQGQQDEGSIDSLFQTVQSLFEREQICFGQLIKESAARDYGRAYWLHMSLGAPHREIARCGQVMTMLDGAYTLVKTVPVRNDALA